MSSWLSCVGTECLNCNLTDDPDEMDPFDSLRLYARVHTGAAKRARRAQLQRLRSRPVSARFGRFLDERSSLGALSKRGCVSPERARAEHSR